jgi:hypothetical protein
VIPESYFFQAGTGLFAEYFPTTDLTGTPMIQVDPYVYYYWSGKIGPTPWYDIGARWTGKLLAPSSELYTFWLGGDNTHRLWIDNILLINEADCCATVEIKK